MDDRPVARRRVEGLKTLLVAHLNAGLPSDKGIRPHLNVTVDLATLLLALGADRTSASTPPTLGGYGVTGRDLIARLACDASLSVVLTDATTDHHRRTRQHSHPPVEATGSDPRARTTNAIGHSSSATGPVPPGAARTVDASVLHGCGCEVTPYLHVLDVGRAERIATPKQRLAVLSAQQHRCAAPGCVNTHLEVHHIVSWLHGGATNMDNLVGLCSTCHTLIHRGLLHCRFDAHGAVVFTRSDGTAILDVRRRTLLAYAHALRDHVSAALLTQHQHDRPRRTPRHTPRRPPRPPEAAQPQRHQHPDDQSDPTTTPPF